MDQFALFFLNASCLFQIVDAFLKKLCKTEWRRLARFLVIGICVCEVPQQRVFGVDMLTMNIDRFARCGNLQLAKWKCGAFRR